MMTLFLERRLSYEGDTIALGGALASRLRGGDFVALVGDLGAGKTTLARALIQAFVGEAIEVPSPTFTLVQLYSRHDTPTVLAPDAPAPLDLFHFDLYRLQNSEEVWELGWEDIQAGIAVVEWPDRAGDYCPDTRLEIALSFESGGRVAHFSALYVKYWRDRLDGV